MRPAQRLGEGDSILPDFGLLDRTDPQRGTFFGQYGGGFHRTRRNYIKHVEGNSVQQVRSCLSCDAEFVATKKQSVGRWPSFCSANCRKLRAEAQNKQYRKEARYRGRPRAKIHMKICAVCTARFATANLATESCGTVCGAILGKRRSDATRAKNAALRNRRQCLHCGRFFQKKRNTTGFYCSLPCSLGRQ